MTKIKSLFIALILSLGVSSAFADGHGSTLDVVKERGKLMCGSNTGLAGFGNPNDAVFGKVSTWMYVVLLLLLYSAMLMQ